MKKTSSKVKTKIRRGDKVVVTAGNCRGQTGEVVRIADDRVIVQGLNLRKKHVKATQENPKGSIIDIEKPIHISNISVCGEDDKPLKLKVTNENGEKCLSYKKGKKMEVYRNLKKQEK